MIVRKIFWITFLAIQKFWAPLLVSVQSQNVSSQHFKKFKTCKTKLDRCGKGASACHVSGRLLIDNAALDLSHVWTLCEPGPASSVGEHLIWDPEIWVQFNAQPKIFKKIGGRSFALMATKNAQPWFLKYCFLFVFYVGSPLSLYLNSTILTNLRRSLTVVHLLFILDFQWRLDNSNCAKCFIIFCQHFICMQIVKPWLFIARCICKQIRHIFRGRSYRWQSNQSKTRKYIFYFFLPWLGIEPRTFKFGIYCIAR